MNNKHFATLTQLQVTNMKIQDSPGTVPKDLDLPIVIHADILEEILGVNDRLH